MYYNNFDVEPVEGRTPLEAALVTLKALKQTENVYKDIGTVGPNADYGVAYKDGSVSNWGYPCHKKFLYSEVSKGIEVTYSKFRRFRGDDFRNERYFEAKAYFDYITGPDSPWKVILDYPVSDPILRDRDFMWDHGFVFTAHDTLPTNQHHQFMVASRMQKEWPYLIGVWHTLVTKYGFTRDYAFAFITLWYEYDKGEGDRYSTNAQQKYRGFFNWSEYRPIKETMYDFPLDMDVYDEEYVLNFLRHKMAGPVTRPFKDTNVYTPVNAVWGGKSVERGSKPSYLSSLVERYRGRFTTGVDKYTNTWNNSVTTKEYLKTDLKNLLEIGLLEQERLYALV